MTSAEEAAITAAKVEAHFAPPPRTWVDYVPENITIDQLRLDWPTLPSGNLAIIHGVEEKLRWMARRMQHGYNTPEELAVRLHLGKELVHFESPAEKEKVLVIAKRLAEEAAAKKTERTGQLVEPMDHSFEPIRQSDRAVLASDLIRGVYPLMQKPPQGGGDRGEKTMPKEKEMGMETQKGKQKEETAPAFMKEVRRMLGNNETYQAREMEKLCLTIQKLVRPPVQRAVGVGVGGAGAGLDADVGVAASAGASEVKQPKVKKAKAVA